MFVVALVGLIGCPSPPPQRANVLLITLDTTRADHLGAYGYFRETSPNLDRLAREGVVFERAWAPMATTLPTHTSIMTGVWPLEHGVLSNVGHGGQRATASTSLESAAQLFADAGWQTAAFTSATPVKEGTGIERGFQHFDDPDRNVRRARPTTEAALGWLRRNGKDPFFVWVHYFDPHGPFDAPAPYDEGYRFTPELERWLDARRIARGVARPGGAPLDAVEAHNGYDGEIRYMDEQLGRLLALVDEREWGERTLVVVVGDHGEGLGQHAIAGHGYVWAEQVRVPWMMRAPWVKPRRVRHQASLVDVMPTILSIVDVPGEDAWIAASSGRDALAGPSGPSLAISSLRQAGLGNAEQVALTVGRWRWVRRGEVGTLYDLDRDPHELVDLSEVLPVHAALLDVWTEEIRAAQRARGRELGAGPPSAVSTGELEALKALGYVE